MLESAGRDERFDPVEHLVKRLLPVDQMQLGVFEDVSERCDLFAVGKLLQSTQIQLVTGKEEAVVG